MRLMFMVLAVAWSGLAFPAQAPDVLAKNVADGFKKRSSIEAIEVTEAKPRSFNMTVWYKAAPTIADARRDTGSLVKSVLKQLVTDGVSPSDNFVGVHVHAGKRQKGVTGKDLYVDYGQSFYNPNSDQVEFEISK